MPIQQTTKIVDRHIPCPCGESSKGYCTYEDGHGYCYSAECKSPFFPPEEGKSMTQTTPDVATSEPEVGTLQYLDTFRGISRATMEFFNVRAFVDNVGKPIYLHTPFDGGGVQKKYLEHKSFPSYNMSGPHMFGLDKFEAGGKRVTITEGAVDTMSHMDMLGKYPVCSVVSSGSAVRDVAANLDKLNSYDEIVLAFDNDEPGRKAALGVHALFPHRKVRIMELAKHNDPNDFLVHGDKKAYVEAWWNAKLLQRDDILSSYDDVFKALNESDDQRSVALPFPKLQRMTFGLFPGDVFLLTAQEGIGKTEVVRAIEYCILEDQANIDINLGVIHLEEDKVRTIKGLTGQALNVPLHLPNNEMPNNEILEAYKEMTKRNDRLHIYTHFGGDSIDGLLDAIRFLAAAADCTYIFLDHITMIATGAMDDQTKGLDYLSTQLKMMAKELGFCLVLVSHVNDSGQTRGSRNIGKIADVRVSLQRELLSEDDEIRNTTRLLVEKNRRGALTGYADDLLFNFETFKLDVKENPLPEAPGL